MEAIFLFYSSIYSYVFAIALDLDSDPIGIVIFDISCHMVTNHLLKRMIQPELEVDFIGFMSYSDETCTDKIK